MNEKQILKERLEILPEKLQEFVLDENWTKESEKIANSFNLNEANRVIFENEIFFVLMGFELQTNFEENIKRELNLEQDIIKQISEEVEQNIFSEVLEELKEVKPSTSQKTEEEIEETEKPTQTNPIGQSFEQIILNQAKAMQPARPAGWIPPERNGDNEPKTIDQEEGSANPPTKDNEPKVIHNYINKPDPYREPIE
ncbi:MAG: hypothetical protein GX627_01235 [Parcubacteria group bacterium]|jgi:septum formation inhibitor MinC|nr:hypothetical protein [Parcubacteria group bacterium]